MSYSVITQNKLVYTVWFWCAEDHARDFRGITRA